MNTSNNITASLYLSCFVNEREAKGGGGGRSFYHLLQSSTQRVRHHTVASRASYLISYILPTPKTAIQIQNKLENTKHRRDPRGTAQDIVRGVRPGS